MVKYRLMIKNESTFSGDLTVYQKQTELEKKGAMSVAWFIKGSNPDTEVEFEWNTGYNFVWSEESDLKPGVIFRAIQVVDTDLKTNNKIELDKNRYGYLFKNQVTDSRHSGELIIEESAFIPGGEASVGIGMSGFATFIWETEPNVDIIIKPEPEYWVSYGIFDQGEILDVQQLVNTSLKLDYPINKYNAVVTLKADNTWGDISYD